MNLLLSISVAQAVPAKSYAFQVRVVNSTTQNGNFFFTGGASNVSISMPYGTKVLKLAVNGSVDNYSRITWNYGSGTLVRPFSLQVRWYIKF